MSVLGSKVRSILPRKVPVGIQILAGANQAALAAALAADLQFVRFEIHSDYHKNLAYSTMEQGL